MIVVMRHKYLQAVLPDFGGPMMANLTGTTGLGDVSFRYFSGCMMNSSLAAGVDKK